MILVLTLRFAVSHTVSGVLNAFSRRAAPELPPIVRRPAAERHPLSAIQEQLWFLDQIAPGQPTYNIVTAARLHGPLDTGALQQALDGLLARHESLRTVFAAKNGRPH